MQAAQPYFLPVIFLIRNYFNTNLRTMKMVL